MTAEGLFYTFRKNKKPTNPVFTRPYGMKRKKYKIFHKT